MTEWIEKQRNELLSKPQSNSVEVKEQLVSAAKVVEEFENPKLSGGNVTRFREANENQAVFVSNAERAVMGIKQEKATPQQWLAMIEKNGGLKAGEDKWLGLSEWLKASDAKTLTKDEVLDFIGENKIVIEEVKYGEGLSDFSNEKLDALNAEFEELIWEGDEETGSIYTSEWVDYAWNAMVERYGDDFEDAFEIEGTGTNVTLVPTLDYNDEISGAARHFLDIGDATGKPINYTRLNYTTEGLENKREIALTVPTIEPWNESDEIHFGDAGEGRAVAWVRFGETASYEEIDDVQEVAEFHEPYTDVNGHEIYKPIGSFRHNDFVSYGKGRNGKMIYVVYINGGQIPVAHTTLEEARNAMNEYYKEHPRKLKKPLKVLVIDEIQSKRHQEGRDKGYDSLTPEERSELRVLTFNRTNSDEYRRAINEAANVLSAKGLLESQEAHEQYFYIDSWLPINGKADKFETKYGKEAADILREAANVIQKREERIKELEKKEKSVPAAPFEKNWHELAMKRMLRLAAEEGFDKVAWTSGAQQAERYDLASRVDEIKVTGGADNIFTVIGRKDGGILLQKDAEGEQGLAELLGKDLARKAYSNLKEGKDDYLNEDGAVSFTGDNLVIGGEGMKGFYDKMLPSFVQKYVKKWGAKVGEVELPELEESARKMWSVDVTTEMKESVMEGQTMFRVEEEDMEQAIAEYQKEYKSAQFSVFYTRNGALQELIGLGASRQLINDVLSAMKDVNNWGAFSEELNRIFIFAENIPDKKNVKYVFKHENAHASMSKLFPERKRDAEFEVLYEAFKNGVSNRYVSEIFEKYKDKSDRSKKEEVIAFGIEIFNEEDILNGLQGNARELYNEILTDNKKDYVVQSNRRNNSDSEQKGRIDARGAKDNERLHRSESLRGNRNSLENPKREELQSAERQILDEVIRLEEELGTAVNAIDSFDALPEGKAKDAIADGRKVLGWYQDGRVYVYMPNARSAGDVRATVYHEVVGHLGLREMLGDRFNAFLGRVYMNLPADVRAELNNRAMRKGWDFREATEEYMAELAERFARGEKVSGLRKVLYAVRDAVVKALRSLGIDLGFEMSDNYLMYVLWASKQNLKPSNVMGRIADRYMRNVLNVEGDVVRPTPPTRPTGTDGSNGVDGHVAFREVTDKETLDFLNGQETMKAYRAMQVIDGKLYPPMSAKVEGKLRAPIELGKWEEAEERPDLADERGYFKLDKANKSSLKARYNPYIHTSLTPLNDQFSSAQERPNLVTVEVEIPVSELTSGYKAAKAKDAVGKVEWKAGVVQSQLTGTRTVILSRWDKPVRIVPESEVADRIVEMFGDKNVVMPSNVVTPQLRAELEKRGVPFVETDNQGKRVSDNVRFNRELDNFKNNSHRGLLHLGKPSEILTAAGVDAEELTLSPTVLHQHLKKHNLSTDNLKGLAGAIQTPILVYKHGEKHPHLVVVTELEAKGGKLSVAIRLDENGNVVEVSNVSSVHSKDATTEIERLSLLDSGKLNEYLRWVEKEKVSDWLGLPSEEERQDANPKLDSVAKVIRNFENPKVEGEKDSAYGRNSDYRGGELRFREVEPEDDVTRMTREAYEKNLKSLSYRLREGFQDSMLSLKELQDAIVKTLGHDLEEYENAYVEENHLSSKNTADFERLKRELYKPLLTVVHKLMKGIQFGEFVNLLLVQVKYQTVVLTHALDKRRWDETSTDKVLHRAFRYPDGILHVTLAAGKLSDEIGIDQLQFLNVIKDAPDGMPIDASALHGHLFYTMIKQQLVQFFQLRC